GPDPKSGANYNAKHPGARGGTASQEATVALGMRSVIWCPPRCRLWPPALRSPRSHHARTVGRESEVIASRKRGPQHVDRLLHRGSRRWGVREWIQHHEVMDRVVVTHRGDAHPGLLQSVGVRLPFATKNVIVDDDQRVG